MIVTKSLYFVLFYSLSDKPNLSYFEAVANEVQRIVGVAFMGIFRMAKVSFHM